MRKKNIPVHDFDEYLSKEYDGLVRFIKKNHFDLGSAIFRLKFFSFLLQSAAHARKSKIDACGHGKLQS